MVFFYRNKAKQKRDKMRHKVSSDLFIYKKKEKNVSNEKYLNIKKKKQKR